jgi:hypothetical protein
MRVTTLHPSASQGLEGIAHDSVAQKAREFIVLLHSQSENHVQQVFSRDVTIGACP